MDLITRNPIYINKGIMFEILEKTDAAGFFAGTNTVKWITK